MGMEDETPQDPEGAGRMASVWWWAWAHPKRRLRLVTHTESSPYNRSGMLFTHDKKPEPPPSNAAPVEQLYDKSPSLRKEK